MLYDLIIIGAGPAGMTAGIYAARRKIKFMILSMDVGGQMAWSSEVENYPGVPDMNGIELTKKFNEHIKEYDLKIIPEEVMKIWKKGKVINVRTNKKNYQAKAVIIATGKKPKKLNVPGEEKFAGKGVSYCAACDAPLYKNKTVAIIGGGNSGLEAALFLSKYAKKVYILDIMEKLGGEPYLRDKVLADKKIRVVTSARIKEILGNSFVNSLKYEQKGKENLIKAGGVFIEIGLVTEADFTNARKNKWNEIMIFRSTLTHEENMTSIPGIFAAGDCTDIPAKQIIAAAGEGCQAALASFDYINKLK